MGLFRSPVPYVQQHTGAIDTVINLWLADTLDKSQSVRSYETYKIHIETFRAKLRDSGLDLDGQPVDRPATEKEREQAVVLLSTAAQGFAQFGMRGKALSPATHNQRLSILSSFYAFARKRRYLSLENPIDLLDRRSVQEYASAQPIPREKVEQALRAIDRTVFAGKRDYALLLVFFTTGRRASEVLSLQWKHIEQVENTAILHFEHCKGGKEMYDKLEPHVWQALREYLQTVIARELSIIDPEQYLWLSFSLKHFKQPLTQRGLADVFLNRLGTMKVHTTRHTFAHSMKKIGADVTEIQARLGHSNAATTGRYLQQLASAENEHASALLDFYGVERT